MSSFLIEAFVVGGNFVINASFFAYFTAEEVAYLMNGSTFSPPSLFFYTELGRIYLTEDYYFLILLTAFLKVVDGISNLNGSDPLSINFSAKLVSV